MISTSELIIFAKFRNPVTSFYDSFTDQRRQDGITMQLDIANEWRNPVLCHGSSSDVCVGRGGGVISRNVTPCSGSDPGILGPRRQRIQDRPDEFCCSRRSSERENYHRGMTMTGRTGRLAQGPARGLQSGDLASRGRR